MIHQVRPDAVFVSLLAGRKVKILPELKKPLLQHEIGFSGESAALSAELINRKTIELVCDIFRNDEISCIHNDSVVTAFTGDDRFWDTLFPLWDKTNIALLWDRVLQSTTFNLKNEMSHFKGAGWDILNWKIKLDLVRNSSAAELDGSLFSPVPDYRDCSFSLRVLVCQTFGAYINAHLSMWQTAEKDDNALNSVLSRSRKQHWNWVSGIYQVIKFWIGPGILSYEDGDYLERILDADKTLQGYKQLSNLYKQFGLNPFPEI